MNSSLFLYAFSYLLCSILASLRIFFLCYACEIFFYASISFILLSFSIRAFFASLELFPSSFSSACLLLCPYSPSSSPELELMGEEDSSESSSSWGFEGLSCLGAGSLSGGISLAWLASSSTFYDILFPSASSILGCSYSRVAFSGDFSLTGSFSVTTGFSTTVIVGCLENWASVTLLLIGSGSASSSWISTGPCL